jgi:thymidylate kinase
MDVFPGKRIIFTCSLSNGDNVYIDGLNKILNSVSLGDRIILLDGVIVLNVLSTDQDSITSECILGTAQLKEGNSLNFPDTFIHYSPVLEEDIITLIDMSQQGYSPNYVMFSMITDADDICTGRKALNKSGINTKIMAKIETKESVKNVSVIASSCDALLLGRGDLSLYVDYCEIPGIQANIASIAQQHNLPYFVATNFLESYVGSGIPSRGEIADLATASLQGATGIMLGKETVYSSRPLDAITLANKVLSCYQISHNTWLQYSTTKKQQKRVIAIEGPNGAGKSKTIDCLSKFTNFSQFRGVPSEFESVALKTRILKSPEWFASVLYYLAGSIENCREIPQEGIVIIDRSPWSTVAVHAAIDPLRIPKVMAAFDMAASHIKFPDLIIYLETDYQVCCERNGTKIDIEQEWDAAGPIGKGAHQRENAFFHWLSECGVPMIFVDGNQEAEERAAQVFKEAMS